MLLFQLKRFLYYFFPHKPGQASETEMEKCLSFPLSLSFSLLLKSANILVRIACSLERGCRINSAISTFRCSRMKFKVTLDIRFWSHVKRDIRKKKTPVWNEMGIYSLPLSKMYGLKSVDWLPSLPCKLSWSIFRPERPDGSVHMSYLSGIRNPYW